MKNYKAYINGEFIDAEERLYITSPLTLEVEGSVPSLKQDDINRAFMAARSSFSMWKNLNQSDRNSYIKLFIKELDKHKVELADIVHIESGKNLKDAIVEIERSIDYIKETLESWDDIKYKVEKIGDKISHQKRTPLGVVLAISPFNYPVNLSISKIIPGLISGNTIVFKAATNGSLVGGFITKLLDIVNIPAGVFNYVTGAGRNIGDVLVQNQEIDMITFTGSVRVGKNITKFQSMKPLVLELGGNDAAYVRNDANIDNSIEEIIGGAFSYSGQRCTAIKRLIVHKDISENFLKKISSVVKEIKTVPLINKSAANYIKELYDDAVLANSKVIVEPIFDRNIVTAGLVQTTKKDRLWKEEQFGPILPIVIVDNDDEAIEIINESNFGLQNSIFTEDIEWATNISNTIESGTVNINGKSSRGPDQFPFSGIKDSGFGVQGIKEALLSMTRIHNTVINNK